MDHSEGVLYFTFYFCRVLIENACDASYPRARNSDKRIRSFNNYDTHDHNHIVHPYQVMKCTKYAVRLEVMEIPRKESEP